MKVLRLRLWAQTLVLLSFFLASNVFAQATTGTLKGEVLDQGSSPMAGVALKLSSPVLQGVREAITGEDGVFRFQALPPGSYRLDAEKEGYKTIIRTNLDVGQGRTVNITLVMEIPEVGETVEVIDRRPVVDTETSTNSMSISGEFLDDLPTGRSFQDAVQFLPGVTGGANPNINGGTAQQNQIYLDGTSTTDPVTGTFAMNLNTTAVESIEVITAGYDARYNQGLGGTINIVTKSGGNTLEADASAYLNSTALQARSSQYTPYTAGNDINSFEFNAMVGGPFVKDRFWFLVNYQFYRSRRLLASLSDIGRDFSRFPLSPEIVQGHEILVKLTAQPVARNKFTLSLRSDPLTFENISQSVYVLPEAEGMWRQGGVGVTLQHELQIGGRAVLTTTGFYQYSTIRVQPMLWKDCEERRAVDGYCLDPDKQNPQITGSRYGLTWGNYDSYDLDRRHRGSLRVDFEVGVDRALGSHTFQLGGELTPVLHRRNVGYIGGQLIVMEPQDKDGDGVPNQDDEVSDLSNYENVERYVIVNDSALEERGTELFLYAQDRWVPFRGFTVNLGGRWYRVDLRNNEGDRIVNTNAFSWGGGFNWDPFRDGKTSLMVNYANVVDPGMLSLSGYLNRSAFNYERYGWDPSQRKWEEDAARASAPESSIKHPDFQAARSHEILVRLQRELARDLSAEATFVWRRQTHPWEDDEVNVLWNADGTDSVGFRTGSATDIYRLRTPADAKRGYWGFTLLTRKNLSDNVELQASYSFSRSTSNTAGRSRDDDIGISADYDNPTQRYYEDGIAGYDLPHVFRFVAKYDNPNVWKVGENVSIGYAFGGILELAAGYPYDRRAYNTHSQGFTNYLFKRGTMERLPATASLDLHGALSVTVKGAQFDIVVNAQNLLNSRDVVGASAAAVDENGDAVELGYGGPSYSLPVSYRAGRQIELGIRFKF